MNRLNPDEMIEIDPKVDFACKMLLGNEQYTHLTVHFLNAVLKPRVRIKSAIIKNPISDKEHDDDKFSIFDVLATDENGWIYDIEIQRFLQTHLAKRVTYYGSLKIVDQLREGHGYGGLCPVVVICILDAVMLPLELPYHNEFRLRTAAGYELTNLYQINVLELPKFTVAADNELIEDPLEQWLYFFRRAQGSTPRELLKRLTDPTFAEALEILQMVQRNPDERLRYESRLKAELDRITEIESAEERGLERGLERGRAEGEALGKIRALQSILNCSEITDKDFAALDEAALNALIAQLQKQIRSRI